MSFQFSFAGVPRIVSGAGEFRGAADVVRSLGRTALLVTGRASYKASGRWDDFLASLQSNGVAWHHATVHGEPSPSVVDGIVAASRDRNIDVVLALGGGSVVDAGKAAAAMLCHEEPVITYLEGVGTRLPTGATLPFVAVPTTSGTGSEATKNAVLSQVGPGGFKSSLRHDNFVPAVALLDPELMVSCPPDVTAACGMDAFTQLLESYVSKNASPMTDALAFSGMDAMRDNLTAACGTGAGDVSVRAALAYGALMSGLCLANAGLGIVHGMAGPLGGLFPVPHGAACGTLLAPATAATIRRLQEKHGSEHPALRKYAAVGSMLRSRGIKNTAAGCEMLVETLHQWADDLRLPRLSAFGITEKHIPAIVSASSNKYNPEPLPANEIRDVLLKRL